MKIEESEFRRSLAIHLRLLANALDDGGMATVQVDYQSIKKRAQAIIDSIDAIVRD